MYQGYSCIDCDSHVLEPGDLWEKYLDPEFRDEAPRSHVGYWGDPYGYQINCTVGALSMPTFLAGRSAPLPGLEDVYDHFQALGFTPDVYTRVLDRTGIDYMVVYPTIGLFVTSVEDLSAATAAAYRRAYNRWLNDFVGACDGRIIGAASVDLRDPVEAAREARRCVVDYGFQAVTVTPNPVTQYPWFHEFHDPLWAALEELDVPLAIHAGAGTPTDVGRRHFGEWSSGRGVGAFSMGNMLQCMALIGGGVLERFPRLRVAHLEVGCGWVPYVLDRMQSGIQGANRSASRYLPMQGLSLSPADYFRRQCFAACDPDDPHLAFVIDEVGDGCIVTATDFGHPEGRGYADALAEIVAIESISDESRRKIMFDNAARLYGIPSER